MTPGGQLEDDEYEDTEFPDERIKLHFKNLAKVIKVRNFRNIRRFREEVIKQWEAALSIIGFLAAGAQGRMQVAAALTSRAPFHDTKSWPFPLDKWLDYFRKARARSVTTITPSAQSD
jgi:hypothetical protein